MSDRGETIFSSRSAMADWDHVPTNLVAEGLDKALPRVTIAITTFKRPEMLIKAAASALAQDFDRPYRICVFDNDPSSDNAALLLEALPELRQRNFSYYVHAENMGIFGNFNRCLALTETEWLTILNDDDLLDPGCVSRLFRTIDADPSIDGIICGKRVLDERSGNSNLTTVETAPRRSFAEKARLALTSSAGRELLFKMLTGKLMTWQMFRGKPTRRIRPEIFYWGSVLGNGVGFFFKTRLAVELGGFIPEEFPSSDHYFFARFAARHHLRHDRQIAATFRIAENESAKVPTIMLGMKMAHRLQQLMAGREVPRWWLRLAPLVMAYHRADAWTMWRVDIPAPEVEAMLHLRLPPNRPRRLLLIRLMLRGF